MTDRSAPPHQAGLISVVMPAYNHARFINQAVHSALRQSHSCLELLIVDDASTDETARIIAGIHDQRINYIRHERNLGPAASVLDGLRQTSGEYVAILNDDDYWQDNLLSTLVRHLQDDRQLAVAFSDYRLVDELGATSDGPFASTLWQNQPVRPSAGRYEPFAREVILQQAVAAHVAAVFRRSVIDTNNFPLDVGSAYDLWLSHLACRNGDPVYFVADQLACFRRHSGSATTQGGLAISTSAVAITAHFLHDPALRPYRTEVKQRHSIARVAAGWDYLAAGSRMGATRSFLRSLATYRSWGALLGLLACLVPDSAQDRVRRLQRHPSPAVGDS